MKFALTSLLLLASVSAVISQGTSSTASSSSSVSSSSSATSSSSASSSSSSSASSSQQAGSSSGGATAAAQATATCTLVSGDPKAQPFGCVEGATTITPPYDSASLLSFQIAKYTAGKEGKDVSSVASNMADTVTGLYPTLTVSYSAIVSQYASELNVLAYGDGAVSAFGIPSGVTTAAAVAVAVIMGGAFAL